MAGKVVPLGGKVQGYARRALRPGAPPNVSPPRYKAPGILLPPRAGSGADGRFKALQGFSRRVNSNPVA